MKNEYTKPCARYHGLTTILYTVHIHRYHSYAVGQVVHSRGRGLTTNYVNRPPNTLPLMLLMDHDETFMVVNRRTITRHHWLAHDCDTVTLYLQSTDTLQCRSVNEKMPDKTTMSPFFGERSEKIRKTAE